MERKPTERKPTEVKPNEEVVQPQEAKPEAGQKVGAAEKAGVLGEEKPVGEIPVGQIGEKLGAGEVRKTVSGRTTTPFPKVNVSTERTSTLTIRRVDKWLMDNAIEEAKARGDVFNLRQFEGENPKNIPLASKDAMEEYLFGENQPPVLPSILKPLSKEKPHGMPVRGKGKAAPGGAEAAPGGKETGVPEKAVAEAVAPEGPYTPERAKKYKSYEDYYDYLIGYHKVAKEKPNADEARRVWNEARGEKPAAAAETAVKEKPKKQLSAEEKADRIQMLKDNIATKKAERQPVPQAWIDKLAELEGPEVAPGEVAGAQVFGHPQATNLTTEGKTYNNLIPIKARNVEQIERRMDWTQEAIDALQSRLVKRKGVKPLDIDEETVLELLKTETMPELMRLKKKLEGAEKPAPAAETAVAEKPGKQRVGPQGMVLDFIDAFTQSAEQTKSEITNVREGKIEDDKGYIEFDFRGKTYVAPEPMDVMFGVTEEADKTIAYRSLMNKTAKPKETPTTPKPAPEKAALEGGAAPTAEGKAKQPWEMRKTEWESARLRASKAETRALRMLGGSPNQKNLAWATPERIRLEYGAEPTERIKGIPIVLHESVI
ncbi:MAG: hypothetical protein ACWGQW_15360, partial [bacterium]